LKADPETFNAFLKLKSSLDLISDPVGTEKYPARTCRDLALLHPEFESGTYWIDPNQGSTKDAIEVFCDIPNHQTCVMPKPATIAKTAWSTASAGNTWFSDNNGAKFDYKIDERQLKSLQLLSSEATQTLTYNCRNSNAQNAHFMSKKTERMAEDDEPVLIRPASLADDECQYMQSKWASTILEFRTKRTDTLPVIDVAPHDDGSSNQGFGLEIGQVCFS